MNLQEEPEIKVKWSTEKFKFNKGKVWLKGKSPKANLFSRQIFGLVGDNQSLNR